MDRPPGDTSVVIWPDTFTDAFRPQVGNDLVVAMEALGERVAVPSGWACCGRTMYDFGMLDMARHSLRRLLKVLGPWVAAGVPVVVPEPSCLAAFRDELPGLLADDPRSAQLASLARSPAEHLVANGHTARLAAGGPRTDAGRAVVQAHCHQRAVVGTDADQAVLAALGYEVEVLDAGCCGLAGSFGFNARHEPVSRTIGEDLWLPKVRAALGHGQGPGPSSSWTVSAATPSSSTSVQICSARSRPSRPWSGPIRPASVGPIRPGARRNPEAKRARRCLDRRCTTTGARETLPPPRNRCHQRGSSDRATGMATDGWSSNTRRAASTTTFAWRRTASSSPGPCLRALLMTRA